MLRPRFPCATPVRRGFRRLSHGEVHYRTAGGGPVVLALHESPRSSLSLLPVIDALADRFTVIAPDTPGYGLSEPLEGEAPTMADFVQAIAELLDSFSLERVALYGAHTGAALALAFAQRHPDRVTTLALDGVSAFTDAEVEAFRTRYLEPWTPAWDGAHVMRAWSRCKDLFTWFPWYEQTPERRLAHEPPGLEALHRSALGFLQSGRHYPKAYVRAAAFRPNAALAAIPRRVTVMAKPDDLIADHLARIEAGPGWRITWLGPDPAGWRVALQEALRGEAPDDAPTFADPPQGSRFVRLGEGGLHVVLAGPQDGPLRLLLPGLPGDVVDLVAREAKMHPQARLAALSPPGCGWSDPLETSGDLLSDTVSALSAAHAALDHGPPVTLAAEGAALVVARLWADEAGWTLEPEAINPPSWLSSGVPLSTAPLLQPLPPRWDGAHLTGAWFQVRDLLLYDTPPGAGAPLRVGDGSAPDLARLEALFRSYVEGPECAGLLEAVVARLHQGCVAPFRTLRGHLPLRGRVGDARMRSPLEELSRSD